MIKLINHLNSPGWASKNRNLFRIKNGARRYSEMITEHYYPVFKELFGEEDRNTAVITVTTESTPITFKKYDRIFCFRHECRYKQQPTIARCQQFVEANPQAEVIFIVWEEGTAEELRKKGMEAIFLPMAIDVNEVRQHLAPIHKGESIIWYGQIRPIKKPFFKFFAAQCRKKGIGFDYISNNCFNGSKQQMSREEIMHALQYYKYGVGVGICAHEMSALGLKVFIYSYSYKCNCAYSKKQGRYYMHRNLCSPEEANINVDDALLRREQMVIIDPVDIKDNVKLLRKSLKNYSKKINK